MRHYLFLKKLSSLLSTYNFKDYSCINKSVKINRSSNKEFFLNIELISEAIKKRKKIYFKYLRFDEK